MKKNIRVYENYDGTTADAILLFIELPCKNNLAVLLKPKIGWDKHFHLKSQTIGSVSILSWPKFDQNWIKNVSNDIFIGSLHHSGIFIW